MGGPKRREGPTSEGKRAHWADSPRKLYSTAFPMNTIGHAILTRWPHVDSNLQSSQEHGYRADSKLLNFCCQAVEGKVKVGVGPCRGATCNADCTVAFFMSSGTCGVARIQACLDIFWLPAQGPSQLDSCPMWSLPPRGGASGRPMSCGGIPGSWPRAACPETSTRGVVTTRGVGNFQSVSLPGCHLVLGMPAGLGHMCC